MTPMITRFVALVAAVAVLAVAAACTPGASIAPSQTPASSASVVVDGLVHAGPICPVEKVPADPACADRPVGAVLIVTTAAGIEVARATSRADGTFRLTLPVGDYVLVPAAGPGLHRYGSEDSLPRSRSTAPRSTTLT